MSRSGTSMTTPVITQKQNRQQNTPSFLACLQTSTLMIMKNSALKSPSITMQLIAERNENTNYIEFYKVNYYVHMAALF
jgi:hypothetical protein